MNDPAELMKQLPIAEVHKLQHIGGKLRVDTVRGERLLIRPIKPRTKIDELEENSILFIPDDVKKSNTPLPSMGIIIKVGDQVPEGQYEVGHAVMFSKYAGVDFTENRTEGQFKIIFTSEVLCTMVAEDGVLADAVRVDEAA